MNAYDLTNGHVSTLPDPNDSADARAAGSMVSELKLSHDEAVQHALKAQVAAYGSAGGSKQPDSDASYGTTATAAVSNRSSEQVWCSSGCCSHMIAHVQSTLIHKPSQASYVVCSTQPGGTCTAC